MNTNFVRQHFLSSYPRGGASPVMFPPVLQCVVANFVIKLKQQIVSSAAQQCVSEIILFRCPLLL